MMRSIRHIQILATTIIVLVLAAFPQGRLAARTVYNLNPGWIFFTDSDTDTDNSPAVNLPHSWSGTLTGNYLKEMNIPTEWRGRRIFLRVGGAGTVADVFVNSHHKGSHSGGSTTFTVEVTDALRWSGSNFFRIVVSNPPRLDVLPTAGEETRYGGIFRGVELIVCEPLSVSPAEYGGDGVWITTSRLTPEKAEGTVKFHLLDLPSAISTAGISNPGSNNAGAVPPLARVRFYDADGQLAAQTSTLISTSEISAPEITLPFTLLEPRLWQGTRNPYLYDVEITLALGDGTLTDSLSLKTGFRTFGIDGDNNFLLNGNPLKLHGVVLHRDRVMVGAALTPFQIEEDVRLIREMGANAVRVAGGRHSDYFYDLCDEAGILVWNDTPFTGSVYPTDIDFVDTPAFRGNGRLALTEMVNQLYNHPSVAMWGIFSNVSLRGDDPIPHIRELDALARQLDQYRLTAASSTQNGDVNFITNLVSFELSLGWKSDLPEAVVPWLEQLRTGWPGLHAGVSYAAGGSIFHQSEELQRPMWDSNLHPEGWQTHFHEQYMHYAVDAPGLWGVFVGNLFDFGASRNQWGDMSGVDDKGLVTFDRKDRKDAFYIYKANWNATEPFVHIAGRRLDTRSERRETIRVYSNLPEVELFVAGRSQGRRRGELGIFVWEDVNLRTGVNRLEARATSVVTETESAAEESAEPSESTEEKTGQNPEAAKAIWPGTGVAGTATDRISILISSASVSPVSGGRARATATTSVPNAAAVATSSVSATN